MVSLVFLIPITGHTSSVKGSYLHKTSPECHHGGYDCEFVDSPTPDLQTKCDICLRILCNPHQTQCCGSIFCKLCVEHFQEQKQPCPKCNQAEFTIFYDKRLKRTLNELKVQCIHKKRGCAWTGELGELDKHLNMNPTRDELLVGCEFVDITCEFSNAGCKACVPRKDMKSHRSESYHLQLLTETMKERDQQIGELTMELQRKEELLAQQTQEIQELTLKLQKIKQEATNVGLQLWNQLPEPIFKQIYNLIQENVELQPLLDTPTPRESSAEPSLLSVNRCFTMEKFEFHKTNNKAWYSEPFDTHQQGYKMCLLTYANGFEEECGTHLSLFTCFLRGEYDDQLRWPFRGKIAIELLDQSTDDLTQGKHHECIMHYDDSTHDCYAQRVTAGELEISPGWGESQFVPHSKLNPENISTIQYLKDDCLKFRVREVLLYT